MGFPRQARLASILVLAAVVEFAGALAAQAGGSEAGAGEAAGAALFTPAARATPPEPGLVSNVFADTDIHQALADISAQTGVTIIPADGLVGTISLELKDVALEEALKLVCLAGGNVFGKVGEGVYLVTPADPASAAFHQIAKTQVVKLSYIDSEDVAAMLPPFYTKFVTGEVSSFGGAWETEQTRATTLTPQFSYGTVGLGRYGALRPAAIGPGLGGWSTARAGTRVAINAPPELADEIVRQIALLDQPPKQIMVEALVVETLASNLSAFAAQGQARHYGFDSTVGLMTYTGVAQDLLGLVSWLVTHEKAETKANPNIVAQEGRYASVEVATEQYFSVVTGPVSYPYTTIQEIDAAISLQIMPRIAEKTGEITMKLRPVVSDVTGQGENQLPIITERNAETTVRVKDGQVIAIGGLLESVKVVRRRKIPILGDIPLVGHFFRSSDKTHHNREVVIFVVPHLLGPDGSFTGPRLLDLAGGGTPVTTQPGESR
jgi:type II secretory pathway component GspD/PulD (secretin)